MSDVQRRLTKLESATDATSAGCDACRGLERYTVAYRNDDGTPCERLTSAWEREHAEPERPARCDACGRDLIIGTIVVRYVNKATRPQLARGE
jgi:hypothetical protein